MRHECAVWESVTGSENKNENEQYMTMYAHQVGLVNMARVTDSWEDREGDKSENGGVGQ